MLISSTGTLVRTPVADISVVGRNTQGVRLIRLGEAERLTGVERVAGLDAGDEGAAIDGQGSDDSSDDSPDSQASADGAPLGDGGSDEVSPL